MGSGAWQWLSAGMVWDLPSLRPKQTDQSDPTANITFHQQVSSPDGSANATAASDGSLTIRDAQTHEALAGGSAPGSMYGVCWRPDGEQLATAGHDGAVRLWSRGGTLLKTFSRHTGPVASVAYHRDGRYLASASQDGSIRLWNALTGDETLSLPSLADNWLYQQAEFSPDGQQLVAIRGKQVLRWSLTFDKRGLLTRMKSLPTLEGHERNLLSLAFHPTTNLLATRSLDGTLRIWNETGRALRTIHVPSAPYAAHDEQLSFSPDGRHLLLRHQNGVIYIFRLEDAN
ncbi:MAG: WD40 repeat domain-containing protein [Planctomycetaceae bacterium]